MDMRRGGLPLLITLAIVVVVLALFLWADFGLKTEPVKRAENQNSNGNAPAETLPSPGTHEDVNGNTKLPAGQQ